MFIEFVFFFFYAKQFTKKNGSTSTHKIQDFNQVPCEIFAVGRKIGGHNKPIVVESGGAFSVGV